MVSRIGVLSAALGVLRAFSLEYTHWGYPEIGTPNYRILASYAREEFSKYVSGYPAFGAVAEADFFEEGRYVSVDLNMLAGSSLCDCFVRNMAPFKSAVLKLCPWYSDLTPVQWCVLYFVMLSQIRLSQNKDLLLLKYMRNCLYVGYSVLAEACRGMSFVVHSDWSLSLSAWPYEKFYNLGEPAGLSMDMLLSSIPVGGVVIAAEKMDGCLIVVSTRAGARGNRLVVNTAGAVDTEQALYAKKFLREHCSEFVSALCAQPAGSFTFMFELVNSAFEPHVVGYAREAWGLYWLGVRNNSTGAFWPSQVVWSRGMTAFPRDVLSGLRMPTAIVYDETTVQGGIEGIEKISTLTTEGAVLYVLPSARCLEQGVVEMVKVKTEAFLAAQHISHVATPGIIYEHYVKETLDSVFASFQAAGESGMASPVLTVIKLYLDQFRYVGRSVQRLCADCEHIFDSLGNLSLKERVGVIVGSDIPNFIKYYLFQVVKGTSPDEVLIPFYRESSPRGVYRYPDWSGFRDIYNYFIPDSSSHVSDKFVRLVLTKGSKGLTLQVRLPNS